MAAVSGDRRFEAAQNDIKERKITKMEDWLTRALDNATEKGMDRGAAKKFVLCVDSLMKNEGYSKERACSVLDSTVDEYENAKRLLTREIAIV